MNKLDWTHSRIEELKELEVLLIEARALNSGGNVTERIKTCEKIAEKLLKIDYITPHDSFFNFLIGLVIDYRIKNCNK